MFSPSNTQRAPASAILPAEPQHWKKIYQQDTVSIIHIVFSIYPLGFAQSDSNYARTVVYTAWMMIMLSMG